MVEVVIVLGLAIASIFSYLLSLALLYFGVLFVPLAVVLCAWTAHRRGMSVWHYAIAGAVCSILFFLPWIYLIFRMRGKSVSATLVRAGYIFLYSIWLFVSTGIAVSSLITGFSAPAGIFETTPEAEAAVTNILWIFTFVSAVLWLASLVSLARKHGTARKKLRKESNGVETTASLIPAAYLQPFALALVNFVLLMVIKAYFDGIVGLGYKDPLGLGYEGLIPILPF